MNKVYLGSYGKLKKILNCEQFIRQGELEEKPENCEFLSKGTEEKNKLSIK